MQRGRAVGVSFGVLFLALLTTQASAQNIDPTSRQNVATTTSSSDVTTLEAKRKLLFSQMLADPSNLDLALEYAALSEKVGDVEAAISTLERMLVFAPGLPRLQYELGVLYYRVGAWNAAKTYFDAVLAAEAVPDQIRTDVETYQAEIKLRQEGSRSLVELATGLRYQTNANAGPASPYITLNGLDFILDQGSLGAADFNAFGTARFHSSSDLESQGDRFDLDISAYGALFANLHELNTGIAEVKLGPNLNLEKYKIDNGRLALYAKGGGAILGGDPYFVSLGLGADLMLALDARQLVTLTAGARQQLYLDSPARPNVSDRSGQDYSGSARYDNQVSKNVKLFARVDGDRTVAQMDYLSSWSATGSAGIVVTIAPSADSDPWVFTLTGGATHKVADAPDPVVSMTDAEVQNNLFAVGTVTVPISNGVFFQGSASYTLAMSNYDMSNYDNIAVSMGLGKRF